MKIWFAEKINKPTNGAMLFLPLMLFLLWHFQNVLENESQIAIKLNNQEMK